MSQGQETQRKVNLWLVLTIVAALTQVMLLIVLQTTRNPIIWIMLGLVILFATIGQLSNRCPECKYDVTRDAEGNRHKGWPRASANCGNCGVELP